MANWNSGWGCAAYVVSCQINNVPLQAYISNTYCICLQFNDVSPYILHQVHIPQSHNHVSHDYYYH